MKKTDLVITATLSVVLALGTACSTNKTAETSEVKSEGAGKGTAPAADTAKKADQALVRFVNGTTASKDLAFGDATPFTGVGGQDVTAYQSLPAERHDFKLYAKDDKTTALATNSEGLSSGKHYTILAVTDKNGKETLDPISDDLTPPEAGQAKVRVINLARGMEDVDLYAGGEKSALISGAGLDHPTDYKNVAPSTAELTVRHGMSKRNSAPVKDLKLEAGKLYTILVFQGKNGKLKVKTVEDQFTAAPNGTAS
ncbi:MAG TPA: DUF4397 domain-containing protein [Bryobacteraceae bacterium]|jgi:uncharacterized protein (DUF2141 family)|nr:DUF4397 domain-containing protein [Bryobacteraceae bacterium]